MERKQSLWSGLRWPVKAIIIALPIICLVWAASNFGWIPGLKSAESASVHKSEFGNEAVNSLENTTKLPVPDINDLEYADLSDKPEMRLMNWVWFGNAGIFSANGGLRTTKGSLMEKYDVNLRLITNNSVADMKREQLAFIQAYASGNKNPATGVHFVTLMGDGAPAYLSAMNEQIEKAYGKDYNLKIIGIAGFSMGEDCGMGPKSWSDNPQNLKGSVISAVIGDGDWALVVRYAADNGIKVNPDPASFDPEAINFVPAPDDDFMKAAEEVIAGRSVRLKQKDAKGNLTGNMVDQKITGCATWFPGDLQIVEKTDLVKFISTKQYPNQMGTVIVGCDKWMRENSDYVTNFLNATLTATNQIKSNDDWFRFATQLAPKVFCANPQDCSESAEDWYKYAKPGGAPVPNRSGSTIEVGGTQMANLSDNKKYFGINGGNNYYKSVFDYFSGVLKDLNPAGFMDNVKGLTSYSDAVDLSYLSKVNVESGTTQAVDYSANKGETFAKRNWKIEFESGSARITSGGEAELQKLFDALNIAESAKVKIVGHTDNSGNPDANRELSALRAKSVKQWLINRSKGSFPSERFNVEGKGQDEPVADNNTLSGKAQNRRVEISLIQ
jgi:OmpA-OmpF porin, OOP family